MVSHKFYVSKAMYILYVSTVSIVWEMIAEVNGSLCVQYCKERNYMYLTVII